MLITKVFYCFVSWGKRVAPHRHDLSRAGKSLNWFFIHLAAKAFYCFVWFFFNHNPLCTISCSGSLSTFICWRFIFLSIGFLPMHKMNRLFVYAWIQASHGLNLRPGLLAAAGSADILSVSKIRKRKGKGKWKFEFRFSKSYEYGRRKTVIEIGIPFSNVVGNKLMKIEVRIPFFNIIGKRETKMEVLIPFSEDVGKRETKMEVRPEACSSAYIGSSTFWWET